MDTYRITFIQEKQFFLGNPTVAVLVDNNIVCELKLKTGDSAEVDIAYGLHNLTLTGSGKRVDTKIFVKENGTIHLKWNKTWGRPEIDNIGAFATEADNSKTAVQNVGFAPTKAIGGYFAINETSREFAVGKGFVPSLKHAVLYSFDDIVDFELIEDGTSITKGGLGRAAVGGLLFGGVGAVVGGVTGGKKAQQKCTSLIVKITVNNIAAPTEYIKLITSPVDKNGFIYKTAFQNAQDIVSILQLICSQRETEKTVDTLASPVLKESSADEIRKFKALMEEGIITEEEFNAKKRQLLGL